MCYQNQSLDLWNEIKKKWSVKIGSESNYDMKQKSCETVTVHALAKTMSTQQGTDKTGEKLRLQVSLLWQK